MHFFALKGPFFHSLLSVNKKDSALPTKNVPRGTFLSFLLSLSFLSSVKKSSLMHFFALCLFFEDFYVLLVACWVLCSVCSLLLLSMFLLVFFALIFFCVFLLLVYVQMFHVEHSFIASLKGFFPKKASFHHSYTLFLC